VATVASLILLSRPFVLDPFFNCGHELSMTNVQRSDRCINESSFPATTRRLLRTATLRLARVTARTYSSGSTRERLPAERCDKGARRGRSREECVAKRGGLRHGCVHLIRDSHARPVPSRPPDHQLSIRYGHYVRHSPTQCMRLRNIAHNEANEMENRRRSRLGPVQSGQPDVVVAGMKSIWEISVKASAHLCDVAVRPSARRLFQEVGSWGGFANTVGCGPA
jgi:hypothetical protein